MKHSNESKINRRNFIKSGTAFFFTGSLLSNELSAAPPKENYQVLGWHGDDLTIPHEIFINRASPKDATVSEKYDVVIVGSGLSGLSAAFRLRNENILVLDRASEFGGNAKASKYEGQPFATGSAYFVMGQEEPWKTLYEELGLTPKAVKRPTDRWFNGTKWIDGHWEEEAFKTYSEPLRKAMESIRKELEKVCDGDHFPETPYENSSQKALKYDEISFAKWLKPHIGESEEAKSIIETYCYSSFGASSETVSAYGGINFLSEILGDIYAFPGGNNHIAQKMAEHIEKKGSGRIQNNCFIYKIDPKNDKAIVYYKQNGESKAVEAKHVILATPYFISKRLLEKSAINPFKAIDYFSHNSYNFYLVANLCFNQVITLEGYDNWFPEGRYIRDFIPAEWNSQLNRKVGDKGPHVVTVYASSKNPRKERNENRFLFSPEKPAKRIVKEFGKLYPTAIKHLKEVHMTRWGHAFLINKPGMFTKWLPAIKKQTGSIYLAHSDGQGLPAVESALYEGMKAAELILKQTKKK